MSVIKIIYYGFIDEAHIVKLITNFKYNIKRIYSLFNHVSHIYLAFVLEKEHTQISKYSLKRKIFNRDILVVVQRKKLRKISNK